MTTNFSVSFKSIGEVFSCWIDSVSTFVASLLSRFASPRAVRLVEDENGEITVQAAVTSDTNSAYRARMNGGKIDLGDAPTPEATILGNHVDLLLQSDRFLFRPLELPTRATEFMPGIVRSQIDRLTPWNAADAAFGWSQRTQASADKMVVTIAATTITLIRPYVDAVLEAGAHSIAVFTSSPDADSDGPIKVWEESGRGASNGRIRRVLIGVLSATGITSSIALGANTIVAARLTAQQDDLARQISVARAVVGAGYTGSGLRVEQTLEQRKHDAASSVLILETLSKILPDQTYVTELRLEGNKVRLTGITRDAPSLIGLIEQSDRFTRAAFFAPTTRSQSDARDNFHIEATIKPGGPSS